MKESSLNGKVIVITGASSGVGRAMAQELARWGASLVLSARREEALAEVVKECEAQGGKAIAYPADVTNSTAMYSLAAAAVDAYGLLDVWVNNAGVLAMGEFSKTPIDIHEQVIRTNLMGYIHGAHAALPHFKRLGRGILINNISVGGWFPTPYAVGYTASKFGLRGYSDALKGELYGYPDIHVCDLYPGFLDTPGIQHAGNYTGRALKPAPPVYDPRRVARAVVDLIEDPVSKRTVGGAATFLKLAYTLFPGLSRRITAGLIESYLKNANELPPTTGNVLQPLDFGRGIDGGWRLSPSYNQMLRRSTLVLAGVVVGLLLLARRARS
jgi:short-subunit dehydrogenase